MHVVSRIRSVWWLTRMFVLLKNWYQVWTCYVKQNPLPVLELRSGIRLSHGRRDAPVLVLFEVFSDGCYRKFVRGELSGVMIDIGANIGATTLDFATRNKRLVIHAYEPGPETFGTLNENVSANVGQGRVLSFNEGVGSHCGTLQLWTNVPSVVATAYGDRPPTSGGVQVVVPMVDLNTCVERAVGQSDGNVCFVKIDAEGAEVDILEGASPLTLSRIDRVAIEYHEDMVLDCRTRCERVLQRAGFVCEAVETESNRGMLYAWRGDSSGE